MIFIDGIIFSLQKHGGISVVFVELLKRLDCNYFLKLYPNESHALEPQFKSCHKNFFSNLYFLFVKIIARYFDVWVDKRFKIFHSSYYRLPLFWQRRRLKIVTTVHDFTYEKTQSGIKKIVHFYQKRRAILNSDVIICISENTKKDMFDLIPESKNKRVHVIYNGVSEDFYTEFTEPPTNIMDSVGSKISTLKKPFVLFVGSRVSYKNFKLVVKALSLSDLYELVIVGGGELSNEETEFLNFHLDNRYIKLGFVDNVSLRKLYSMAYCLCYPSIYEGFGIPIVEAMRSGCPVIAYNGSSIPEVCENSAILFSVLEPKSLHECFLKLNDVVFRDYLIKSGLTQSMKFNWSSSFEHVKEIYSNLNQA